MSKYGVVGFLVLVLFVSSAIAYSGESFSMDVVASSFLNEDARYSIGNLFDNNISTYWAEGAKGDGSGSMEDKLYVHCDQWYTSADEGIAEQFMCIMPFPPQVVEITKIRIYNGNGKNELLWKAHNRVKKLGVEVDVHPRNKQEPSWYSFEIDLWDEGWNEIEITDYLKGEESILFPSTIRFYILETYKGSRYNDSCISEVEFYAGDEKLFIDEVEVIVAEHGMPTVESD